MSPKPGKLQTQSESTAGPRQHPHVAPGQPGFSFGLGFFESRVLDLTFGA